MDCEIGSYVNVYRVTFQDTLGQSTLLKGPKRCCNLQDSLFIIFVHYSGKAPAGKSLSYYYLKS